MTKSDFDLMTDKISKIVAQKLQPHELLDLDKALRDARRTISDLSPLEQGRSLNPKRMILEF